MRPDDCHTTPEYVHRDVLLAQLDIILHCESKKGATLTMAITLTILDGFAKFFYCCKEQ